MVGGSGVARDKETRFMGSSPDSAEASWFVPKYEFGGCWGVISSAAMVLLVSFVRKRLELGIVDA